MQFKEALIWWIVLPIRLVTVVTDSGLILADGKLLTSIWKTTVISDPEVVELVEAPSPPLPIPPPVSCLASREMVNPEGSKGMYEGSSPLIAMLMAGSSTGQ